MKRLLLSFVAVFVLIPCIAQQTPASNNLRPLTPCFPFGLLNPASQTICTGSKVVFIAGTGFGTQGVWEMSIDNGITWVPSIGNATSSAYYDTLVIPVVSENMNGYQFRWLLDGNCPDAITDGAVLTVANIPLNIISQPVNVIVCKFYPVDFVVTVLGSSLRYQWQVSTDGGNNFTNINGKTAPALHFDSAYLAMNNNRYRCILNSECSPTVITDVALLTVKNEAVAIVTQPANQFACIGDSVVFNIGVTGNDLAYQWQKRRNPYGTYANIAGENAPAFNAVATEGYVYYRCAVTGSCKTLFSHEVQVTPIDTPFMSNAEIKYLCSGEQAYLSFGYVGYQQDQLYNYQWQVSSDNGATFSDVAGGNAYTLMLTANVSINNLIYRCHVSNSCFDGYSNFKILKAGIPVSITGQPQNTNGCAGFPVSVSVKTIGSVSQYRWQESRDGGLTFTDIPIGWDGVYGPELKITFTIPSQNNYQYRCKISSNCFDTVYSNAAVLHVFDTPIAPNDTSTEVSCDSCKINIAALLNTSGYAASSWNVSDSSNTGPGKYTLKVFNTPGCFDSAFAYVNVHDADTLRICPNAVTLFHCSVSGSSYQWQINNGSGFADITDLYGITGSTTPDIMLRFTKAAQIRCKVDNTIYSKPTFVKITAYWTGNADSDWFNPLNWSCGEIPSYYGTEVIILNNTAHTPEIRKDAACKVLIMKPGAAIIIKPGFSLYITGAD